MYGPPPLKTGRLLHLIENRVQEVTRSIQNGIPRYRLTGQKRKFTGDSHPTAQKTRKKAAGGQESASSNSILRLYKTIRNKTSERKSISPLPTTPTTSSATPSSSHADGIDNPKVEEQWNRKPKRKFSYFNKGTLKKIQRSPTQLKKYWKEHQKKKNSKTLSSKRMKNGLIDNPGTYIAPQSNFVVAKNSAVKQKLYQSDYKTLVAGDPSINALNYILSMIISQSGKTEVQFKFGGGSSIVFDQLKKKTVQSTTWFLLDNNGTHSLTIINFRKRTFSFVSPPTLHSPEGEAVFLEFEKQVEEHNNSCGTKLKFAIKLLDHQIVKEPGDITASLIHFTEQYLKMAP